MKKGICRICGHGKLLSNEHTPPATSLNTGSGYLYSGKDIFLNRRCSDKPIWELPKNIKNFYSKGVAFKNLCEKCNIFLGTEYVPFYKDFVMCGFRNIEYINSDTMKIKFINIYPLRILKQIISMFLTINNPNLGDKEPILRNFVQKPDTKFNENKFHIYLYYHISEICRYIGMATILNTKNKNIRQLSEISFHPFGYVMELNPTYQGVYYDITFFGNNYEKNEKVNIDLTIPVLEVNTPYPADYRTKGEIIKHRNIDMQKVNL